MTLSYQAIMRIYARAAQHNITAIELAKAAGLSRVTLIIVGRNSTQRKRNALSATSTTASAKLRDAMNCIPYGLLVRLAIW